VTRNAPVQAVLNMLAEQQGLNLISTDDVRDTISVTLTNVAFEDALNSIVAVAGCTWTQNRGIVLVSKMGGDSRGTPDLQGKIVQVLPLNFVAAADVEAMVKGLLSPLGQVFTSHTQVGDKRRTQELVIVEDIPTSVSRITQYIQQIDQPPRQVMIEAHVLQVDLTDNMQHGVDWKFLTTYMGRNVGLNTAGFTNAATSPTSIFSFDGDHLDLVVQALKTTTDAKTLASPKVIVANGQEARIQIGSKLGYFVTTTTQTSTLQNVNFLNTGVLLRVTPQISNDGRVLMAVRPEVSTGSISAAGLPQTNTTEAETTVLMDDNGGMIIGGLIKEADSDTQNKVPLLGDLWLIGRLFQQRSTARTRSEIIIVLIPRIAPYLPDVRAAELANIQRTVTPLFQNGLQPAPRPGDPRLPDAIKNPRRLIPSRLPDLFANPQRNNPRPLNYYFPTEDEEFNPVEPLFLDLPVFDDRPFEVSPPPETLSGPPPVTLPAIEPTRPAALLPDLNSARSGAVPPPPAPAF
jgi:type IV pilus assembly protein PilQ